MFLLTFTGVGLLEPYSSSGFVLKDRWGVYVDRSDTGKIIGSKSEQSILTFIKIGEFRIQIKADNGKFMCNENSIMKASKTTPDETCVLRVYNVSGKLTVKTVTGLFMGNDGYYNMMATRVFPWDHGEPGMFIIESPNVLTA